MTVLSDNLSQAVIDFQGMEILDVMQLRDSDNAYVHIKDNCTTYNDPNLGSALIIKLL